MHIASEVMNARPRWFKVVRGYSFSQTRWQKSAPQFKPKHGVHCAQMAGFTAGDSAPRPPNCSGGTTAHLALPVCPAAVAGPRALLVAICKITEGGMAGVLLPFASVQGGPLGRCALPMEMPQACSRHAGWMVNTD